MSNKPKERSDSRKEMQSRRPLKISTIIDAIAKLAAASAIVSGAFIANTYQSKMTSINLINQREQAESQLRANMFSNLIGPIVGPYKDDVEIKPDREQLLVELLALNFHEHFEFKPLLLHVNERISEESRDSLISVARRVINRQIVMLIKEGAPLLYNLIIHKYLPESQSEKNESSLIPKSKKDEIDVSSESQSKVHNYISHWTRQKISEKIQLESPDGKWALDITITDIDWEKQTVSVIIIVQKNPLDKEKKHASPETETSPETDTSEDIDMKFTLTFYDFPLTDNTSLADGNRFSLVINSMNKQKKTVTLKLIWFPKDYFTPRERPINYREYLEKLGIR